MNLADAHMHFFRHGYHRPGLRPLFGDREVEVYEALRAEHQIELTLAVGYEDDAFDPDNNAYLRSLARQRPWLKSLAYVAPGGSQDIARVGLLLESGHAGISVYTPGAAEADLVVNWPARWWEALHNHNAVVSFNAPPQAITALARHIPLYPNIQYLFSHLGLPGLIAHGTTREAIEHRLRPLLDRAASPNVHVKISGIYATSDPPHLFPHAPARSAVEAILDAFGASRCLWASDFAPALDFVSFPQTLAWPGSDELAAGERQLICHDNLVRLLSRVRQA